MAGSSIRMKSRKNGRKGDDEEGVRREGREANENDGGEAATFSGSGRGEKTRWRLAGRARARDESEEHRADDGEGVRASREG